MTDYGILSLLPVAVVIVLVFFYQANRSVPTGGNPRRCGYASTEPGLPNLGWMWSTALWAATSGSGWCWSVGFSAAWWRCSKPPAGSMASPPSRPRFAREKNGPWWPVGSLGIVTFVDDWLSILSVGTAMRRATDRFHIPREMLAFLSNATATSICVIVPTSTWGVFMISQLVATDVCTSEAGMSTFVQVLPFLFYPLVALLWGFLYSVGILPKLVPCAKPTPWPRSRQLL